MSKISEIFKQGPAYVGYLTAGDGGMEASLQNFQALVKGGVNIVEVGVPFTDPIADGPTIQDAVTRSLAQGTTLDDVLVLIKQLRKKTEMPIILFSYYNPIFAALKNDLLTRAKAAGVDGCLIVDLPIEEAKDYEQACMAAGIDPIFIISPSTPFERIRKIDQHSKGMLYYACRSGTTGVREKLPDDFVNKLADIKSVASWPVVAGFGISNQEMAKAVILHADGFVIGSLFVKAVANGNTPEQLTELVRSIDPRRLVTEN